MEQFIDKHREGLLSFARNLFFFCVVLLLIDKFSSVVISKFISLTFLIILSFFFAFSWLFFYMKKNESYYKQELESHFKYFFTFLLLLIIMGSLQFKFLTDVPWFSYFAGSIKNFQLPLALLAIGTGFFTFYFNRERVEREIEDEKVEKKKYKDFDTKFKRLAWFNFEYGVSRAWKDERYFLSILRALVSPFVWFVRLPYSFVKWMYKEGGWYSMGLVAIMLIGFLIRFYLATHTNLDLDEGIHTYDAKLIFDGKIPFVDYFTREPYFIYVFSLFLKFTSYNLFFSRLFSVIITFFISIVIYLIARNYSKNTALVSLLIFNFSPSILYYTYLANLYTLFAFVLLLTLLFLLKFIKHRKILDLTILGFLLGAGVHFYRLMILYIFFVFILLIFKGIDNREKFILFISSFVPFIVPLIYFSYLAGYPNFEIQYGTNELLIGYFCSILILIFGYHIKNILNKIVNCKKYFSLFLAFLIIVMVFAYLSFGQSPILKNRVIFQGLIISYFFIFPLILVISNFVNIKTNFLTSTIYKIFFASLLFYLSFKGSTNALNLQNFGVRLPSIYEGLFIGLICVSIYFIFLDKKIKLFVYKKEFNEIFIFTLIPFVFSSIHVQFGTSIFILSSIIFLVPISNLIVTNFKIKNIKSCLMILIIVLFIFPMFFLMQPLRDRLLTQDTLKEVIHDIKSIDHQGEYILTGMPIFAIESNKKMILDDSRPTIYLGENPNNLKTPNYIGLTKNLVSTEDFILELEKVKPKILILDIRLRGIINSQENLRDYINVNYLKNKTYIMGDLELWIRKE